MIQRLLIANRGEIACRIIRTCREMGIVPIAVYSSADAHARHVAMADLAVYIGDAPPTESYLRKDAIIAAAQRTGADAIHPGFGFLAENADFAQACADAGLIFVGPPVAAIAAMGSKRAAKERVAQFGVPTVPGYNGADQSDATLTAEAERIGYPLMVKASAGGGGKGMRIVNDPAHLMDALASARREASQAFGSDELILERAILKPRHIEFQVLGDQHGHLIHLGERECSIQRRHQKIIEETPSPALTPDLRERMGQAAVAAAQSVGYNNAGTVEFLLGDDGAFYFLEMNTRLQVEHPVTELVTGIDLVAWQIRIAEGQALTLQQDDVRFSGHAMEARVYAENPANGFLPATGEVHLWREPHGVRVDGGLNARDHISIYYDPMVAKVIAHGADRAEATRRLIAALRHATLFGVANNLAFLRDLLAHPAYLAGELHTGFIDQHFSDWREPTADPQIALIGAALLRYRHEPQPPIVAGHWRNNPNQPLTYRFAGAGSDDSTHAVHLTPLSNDAFRVQVGEGAPADVHLHAVSAEHISLTVDDVRQALVYAVAGDTWYVQDHMGRVARLEALPILPVPRAAADAGGSLRAPMPGAVIAVLVEVGQAVRKGDALMKLEAMKMEHTICTASDGVVEAIYYAVGDTVAADAQLLTIRA